MEPNHQLQRFINAQEQDYATALNELKNGRKRSHWMWYIFPQIQGLGFSSTSQHYAISDLQEAAAYLRHPILGQRIIEISKVLIQLNNSNASQVFGNPDDMKLKSSMTLFASVPNADAVFQQVLDKFFHGNKDQKTLTILGQQ